MTDDRPIAAATCYEATDAVDLGDLQRFLAKVQIDPDTGCWEWTGSMDRKGYGKFWWRGKCRWAHRWAYEAFIGPIPDDKTLHHLCGNPGCVKPAHLRPASNAENVIEANHRVGFRGNQHTQKPKGKEMPF